MRRRRSARPRRQQARRVRRQPLPRGVETWHGDGARDARRSRIRSGTMMERRLLSPAASRRHCLRWSAAHLPSAWLSHALESTPRRPGQRIRIAGLYAAATRVWLALRAGLPIRARRSHNIEPRLPAHHIEGTHACCRLLARVIRARVRGSACLCRLSGVGPYRWHSRSQRRDGTKIGGPGSGLRHDSSSRRRPGRV